MSSKLNRVEWVDALKGFAIILIVFGHTIPYSNHLSSLQNYLVSFHVPLFFIISGLLYKEKKETFLKFFKRKFMTIMIPFYIFGLLYLIPYYFWGNSVAESLGKTNFNLIGNMLSLLYGTGRNEMLAQNSSLWFLPCYFSTVCIQKIIDINIKDSLKNNIIISFMLFILGFFIYKFFNITLPLCLEIAIVMCGFVYFGKIIQKIKILENKYQKILIIPFLGLGFVFHLINGHVSCMANYYSHYYLIFVVSSLFSILGYVIFFKNYNNKMLSYLGKISLPILLLHKPIILLFQTKLGIITNYMISSNIYMELLLCIFCLIISFVFCILFYNISHKYFPILYGELKGSKK